MSDIGEVNRGLARQLTATRQEKEKYFGLWNQEKGQNKIYAERLSRVAQALGKASEYIVNLRGMLTFGERDLVAGDEEYAEAMKVVNSGLGDDNPPPCAQCHGTGVQSRAKRVLEREEESKPKQEKGWE